ncbi:ferritin-like domain-containing protein [Kitasatospora xanthocidica]|uniref:ferritin-like domain-containing protein n=1 Tax=Kitasatospora xanthocidica TaxID=83382 RepID=UPI0036EA3B53
MQPPSRRTFLALGLLTLTACTTDHTGPAAGRPGLRPDPDVPVRLRAIAATDALLAGYDALTPPDARTAELRAEHVRHRAALAEGLPSSAPSPSVTTTGAATGTPTATGTGSGTPTATTPTADGPAALELRTAESRLADLDAASPSLARLLASVAAADARHAAVLGTPVPPAPVQPAAPPASPTPTPTRGPSPDALTALQDALGAEHAAVYGYGVVGAHLPGDPQRADARTAHAAHQAQRDGWQRLLTSLDAAPAPAAGGYRLPFPVNSPADAARLAAHLETRLTTVYADLVAAVPAPHRRAAALALRDCTLRAHRWGAPGRPFPGIADPAPTPTAAPATG